MFHEILSDIEYCEGMLMKRLGLFLVFVVVASSGMSAWAGIHSADLIGEWCLVHQSMLGHDFEFHVRVYSPLLAA